MQCDSSATLVQAHMLKREFPAPRQLVGTTLSPADLILEFNPHSVTAHPGQVYKMPKPVPDREPGRPPPFSPDPPPFPRLMVGVVETVVALDRKSTRLNSSH